MENRKKENKNGVFNFILVSIVIFFAIVLTNSLSGKNVKTDTEPDSSAETPIAESETTETAAPIKTSVANRIEIPADGLVIFDNDGILITATSIQRASDGLITGLDVLLENNNDIEKVICFWPDAALGGPITVNGYSMKTHFNETVAAGKKSKAKIEFDSDTVELLQFENLYELVAPFGTYESRDDLMKHNITTYKPETIKLGALTIESAGELIYNENGIEVYKCGFKNSVFSSNSAIFVIKNNLGSDKRLNIESVSVNGLMNDTSEFIDIFDSTYSVLLLPLRYDDGKKYDEGNVDEIEFTLKSNEINNFFSFDSETIGIVAVSY